MILKKPYAFLIKYFKLIHIILSLIIFFITSQFRNINTFFSQYVKGNIRGTIGLAAQYINPLIYILIFIVIIFSLVMFLLMRKKEKPTLLYITLFVYYLILLILVIIASSVMNSIEESSLLQQAALAYRDIYLMLSVPQYYFLIMSTIRGIGFDVKKFNFNKDLEELEIKSDDNEEFEFVLGTDTYKYQRKIRRTLRELKYYVLENRLIFTGISIVVGIFLLIFIFNTFNIKTVFNKIGSQGIVDGLNYKVLSAYETKYDYAGQIVSNEHKYVIIEMKITNNTNRPRKLNSYSISLKAGREIIYNSPTLSGYFIDMGKTYTHNEISPMSSGNYLLIFEIKETSKINKYQLNFLRGSEVKKGVTNYIHDKVNIKPKLINQKTVSVERKVNEVMYLGENLFNNSNIIFRSAEIKNSYEYKYEVCDKKNICKEYYDIVAPDNPANNSLIILNYKLNLSDDIGLKEVIKTNKLFFDHFLKVEYMYNGRKVIRNINAKISPNLKDMVFIEIPKSAVRSQEANLLIINRNNKYFINLIEL